MDAPLIGYDDVLAARRRWHLASEAELADLLALPYAARARLPPAALEDLTPEHRERFLMSLTRDAYAHGIQDSWVAVAGRAIERMGAAMQGVHATVAATPTVADQALSKAGGAVTGAVSRSVRAIGNGLAKYLLWWLIPVLLSAVVSDAMGRWMVKPGFVDLAPGRWTVFVEALGPAVGWIGMLVTSMLAGRNWDRSVRVCAILQLLVAAWLVVPELARHAGLAIGTAVGDWMPWAVGGAALLLWRLSNPDDDHSDD